jgi:hypothetical protein
MSRTPQMPAHSITCSSAVHTPPKYNNITASKRSNTSRTQAAEYINIFGRTAAAN